MAEPAPPEWWFYHLSRTALEEAAAPLLQKCLEVGWRVLAVSPRAERLAKLDAALWTFDDASFLPHGQADAPGLDAARQPVLLTAKLANANSADALVLMDGMEAPVDASFKRCMVMFEDADHGARGKARAQFKAAKDAGLVTRYFQQTDRGGWKEAGV
ncbi:DNA polymerase III subunit chi [Hyphomonas sp. WL0036]|uniref:DNA polymerase III subunit chi n=1 Tax=Hyphomonas sediminis TaxID=2866160 RepID=UPI001C7FCB62|nr:DNA polymerase III subunit chi [Hyphomonas sediminis]MBY9067131.1 DNA polymerase III subunit chi [Hyphomonas sediminis]